MKTIKLNVSENIYEQVLLFLQNLRPSDIQILEQDQTDNTVKDVINLADYQITGFQDIKDPVAWQKELRKEWE